MKKSANQRSTTIADFAKAAGSLLLLLAMAGTIWAWLWIDYLELDRRPVAFAGGPSKPELRQAMRYHGVQWSCQAEDGTWYFVRNDKVCKLF